MTLFHAFVTERTITEGNAFERFLLRDLPLLQQENILPSIFFHTLKVSLNANRYSVLLMYSITGFSA